MPQVTMKQAVAAAKDAIKNLYEDSPLKALALEELELVNDSGKERWAVTLGFYRPKSVSASQGSQGTLSDIYLPKRHIENRDYKTIYIDAGTGEFVKMEIRPAP